MSDLDALRDTIRQFAAERDWEKFHDPKSLMLALVGEVGELAELLQWLPADEVVTLASDSELRGRLGEELADVLTYLIRLADVLDIELAEVTRSKLDASRERFPIDEFRSTAPSKLQNGPPKT